MNAQIDQTEKTQGAFIVYENVLFIREKLKKLTEKILRTGWALHRAVLSLSFYNTLAQWNIIIVFLVLSYLSYVAALLLCYTLTKHLF